MVSNMLALNAETPLIDIMIRALIGVPLLTDFLFRVTWSVLKLTNQWHLRWVSSNLRHSYLTPGRHLSSLKKSTLRPNSVWLTKETRLRCYRLLLKLKSWVFIDMVVWALLHCSKVVDAYTQCRHGDDTVPGRHVGTCRVGKNSPQKCCFSATERWWV